MLSRVPERKREVVEVATNRGETMQPRITADFSEHPSETRPRLSMAERLENFSEVGTNADPCMQESCELRLLKTVNHRLICLVLPRPPSQRRGTSYYNSGKWEWINLSFDKPDNHGSSFSTTTFPRYFVENAFFLHTWTRKHYLRGSAALLFWLYTTDMYSGFLSLSI